MKTPNHRRNAFTLLELLVVVAIIALLASALMAHFAKAKEAGWAARCKANLRTLYQATLNYENDHNQDIPVAGPYELYDAIGKLYVNFEGWVTWVPKNGTSVTNLWPDGHDENSHVSEVNEPTWFGKWGKSAITNGVIWEYTNLQLGSYLCPKFAKQSVCGRTDAVRSYAMNEFFYCSTGRTNHPSWDRRNIQWNLGKAEPSRLILFSEMQPMSTQYPLNKALTICRTYANGTGLVAADGQNQNSDGNDSVLDPGNGSDPTKPFETIGCVHNMSGVTRGHVVFLDGHVEAVGLINLANYSSNGTNLTYVGCTGQY